MVSCPDLVRGHPRECIQMRCFICITQAAALFPRQSALSWSPRRRRLFLLSRGGPRGPGQGHGSPVSCCRHTPLLALALLLPCILAPAPPPPLDGVAILWSLLRQRWSRPACLKCTQMQIDLSSRVWEAQLGTAAPFLTPFPQNPAWKGELKKINLTGVVFVWFRPALVSGCCLLCSANISYLACSFFFGCIWNNDVILIFFLLLLFLKKACAREFSWQDGRAELIF